MEMGATAAWVFPMTINMRSRHAATVNTPASRRALSASFHFASGPRDLLIRVRHVAALNTTKSSNRAEQMRALGRCHARHSFSELVPTCC